VTERPAVLIATRYDQIHDDAFARQQLRLLLEEAGAQVAVADDYSTPAIDDARCLVTYIAKTPPGEAEAARVRRFVERGGRWFAMHTSNAIPADCRLPEILGSRFVTHPPYGPFRVEVGADPLLAGIEPFDVEDELYVCERADDLEVLLYARWGGTVRDIRVEIDDQPLMYRRRVGAGEVLYLALGHCNPAGVTTRGAAVAERRGSWVSPTVREIVRRGITWAVDRTSPA
jgi:type 1 glutamine amidotransferase